MLSVDQLWMKEANTWPESRLQEHVRSLFVATHWKYYHVWHAKNSPSGYPDVIAVKDGRIIWAELKRQNKEPTEDQKDWLLALAQIPRAEVYVWKPYDWLCGDIQAIIEDVNHVSSTRISPDTVFRGRKGKVK